MNLERVLAQLGWRPRRRAGKFVAYFRLVDACAKPGCPVCRCLRDLAVQSLDTLLYEHVTDPATRNTLRQSRGFCAWHAALSAEVRSPGLGMATICQDLLKQARAGLEEAAQTLAAALAAPWWRRLLREVGPLAHVGTGARRRRCPLCRALGDAEADSLHTVLDHVDDAGFDSAYARSPGLCLPHVTLALAYYPRHPGAARLLAGTCARLDALAAKLGSFIDKHDYRAEAPFSDAEVVSWRQAASFLTGDPELFGHAIPRPLDVRVRGVW